ncbi:AAA family ATPase [Adlercreutzia equolifaciens]|uniref:AAA family ATPase n=1 Tax=Adlercreutzia equolifaciens TaxID=446660 RepID=UPI001CC4FC23|nr:AAA family ATPase [Adlercreutzia equolifaciens]
MSSIVISRLKGIRHLEFQIPGASGVYLLVGKNGCGKSTLLTCLHRIGFSNAFRNDLPCGEGSSKVDQYTDTQIAYESPEGTVQTFAQIPAGGCRPSA